MSLASAFISAFTSYPLSLCCWLIYGHGFVDKHTLKKTERKKKGPGDRGGKKQNQLSKSKGQQTLDFDLCLLSM